MVLNNKNTNSNSNTENMAPPPVPLGSKALVTRLTSSIQDASRRRRARTSGKPTPKYTVHLAKKKNAVKAAPVRFPVRTVPTTADVEMRDASGPKKFEVGFPRELTRPDFCDVSPDALAAIDPLLAETELDFLRDHLDVMGSDLLQSLSSVVVQAPTNRLPTELEIIVNNMTSILPTHVLAISSKVAPSGSPRKITLYPVHSLVFATQCARMPAFPPTLPVPAHAVGQQKVTVPVFTICIPSPATYPQLSKFLYNKRPDVLMKSMLPYPPPPMLAEDPSQLVPYATQLAETFTVQALAKHTFAMHGLWQNVCAMGIYNDVLWDTMDVMWQCLLTALAISTGKPSLMIPPHSSETTPITPEASSSSSTSS